MRRALPFEHESFDHVWMMWFLEHVADPLAVLREARRVLVRGGAITAIEVDYSTCRAEPSTPAFEALIRAMVPGMAAAGWSDAGTRLPEWLHEAGFREIDPGERPFWWQSEDLAGQASYAADVLESALPTLAQLPGADEQELRAGLARPAPPPEPPRRGPRLGRAQVDGRAVDRRRPASITECARPAHCRRSPSRRVQSCSSRGSATSVRSRRSPNAAVGISTPRASRSSRSAVRRRSDASWTSFGPRGLDVEAGGPLRRRRGAPLPAGARAGGLRVDLARADMEATRLLRVRRGPGGRAGPLPRCGRRANRSSTPRVNCASFRTFQKQLEKRGLTLEEQLRRLHVEPQDPLRELARRRTGSRPRASAARPRPRTRVTPLVVSTLLEPCPCAGLRGSWGSPFAWSVSAGMSLLPGASPASHFPQNATCAFDGSS